MKRTKVDFLRVFHKYSRRYELLFMQVRQKISVQNIHDLRVASRRLEAALQLAGELVKISEVEKLNAAVQKLSRRIGKLRDLQMASFFFESYPILRLGRMASRIRIKQTQQQVAKQMRQVNLEKQKRWMTKVSKVLALKPQKSCQLSLTASRHALKHRIKCFVKEFKQTPIKKQKRIHRLRREAKAIGYLNEILRSSAEAGDLEIDLLSKFQQQAGDLQNLKVLTQLVKRCAEGPQKKAQLQWIQGKGERHLKRLAHIKRELR